MRSKWPAPTSWATTVFIAIITPITVTSTIDQTEAPSDTAASSAALTWPVMATSATPMPTVAICPTSIGQESFHTALISVAMGEADEAVAVIMGK
jgi:hypothetical protein